MSVHHQIRRIEMNRLYMMGAGALLAASTAASGLVVAGCASASALPRAAPAQPAAAASCQAARHNYGFPRQPVSYTAGAAGSVTVVPVNAGTIKVARVHGARGYRAFVDSAQGSSVDVYFRSHARSLKFEAEINDARGLTVIVTMCRR
jgi:hypothetical protein